MAEPARDLVKDKIGKYFPGEEYQSIFAEFTTNGINDERIQLAVSKLSEGKLEKLREFIGAAKIDSRDVLAWAEYPEEFSEPTWNLDAETVKQLRERDKQQYLDWLYSER